MNLDRSRLLTWVVLVASMIAVGATAVTGIKARSYAQCQAKVNDQLILALKARGQAVDQRDAAFDELINGVLQAHSAAESRAALERYRQARAKVTQDREDHPLPAAPSQTC